MSKDFKSGFKKAVVGVVAVATLGAFVVPSGLSAVYAEEVDVQQVTITGKINCSATGGYSVSWT